MKQNLHGHFENKMPAPKKRKVPPLGAEGLLCLVTCPIYWEIPGRFVCCSTISALTSYTFLKTVPTVANYTKTKKLCIKFDENVELKKKENKKELPNFFFKDRVIYDRILSSDSFFITW